MAKKAPKILAYPAYPSGGNRQLVGPVLPTPKKTPKKGKR